MNDMIGKDSLGGSLAEWSELKAENAVLKQRLETRKPADCKCDFRGYMLGDGCEVCNPAKALEYAKGTIEDLEQRVGEQEAAFRKLAVALDNPTLEGETLEMALVDWAIGKLTAAQQRIEELEGQHRDDQHLIDGWVAATQRLRDFFHADEGEDVFELAKAARASEAMLIDHGEALRDSLESFSGLIGYGPDCDEKIAAWDALDSTTATAWLEAREREAVEKAVTKIQEAQMRKGPLTPRELWEKAGIFPASLPPAQEKTL